MLCLAHKIQDRLDRTAVPTELRRSIRRLEGRQHSQSVARRLQTSDRWTRKAIAYAASLNPNFALFFVAFLPQSVDLNAPNQALSLLFLDVLFNLIGTLWNLGVACSAGDSPSRCAGVPGSSCGSVAAREAVYFGAKLAFETEG
jgi:threonine/homoserine/homoserine lactone efflux protein